jgi:hypothetical protein
MAHLTNDEEREAKALTKKVGAYNIVYIPESFGGPQGNVGDVGKIDGINLDDGCDNSDDDEPHVIILKHFEEPIPPRQPSMAVSTKQQSSAHIAMPEGSTSDLSPTNLSLVRQLMIGEPEPGPVRESDQVLLLTDHNVELVVSYLQYHRQYIAKRVMRVHDVILHATGDI